MAGTTAATAHAPSQCVRSAPPGALLSRTPSYKPSFSCRCREACERVVRAALSANTSLFARVTHACPYPRSLPSSGGRHESSRRVPPSDRRDPCRGDAGAERGGIGRRRRRERCCGSPCALAVACMHIPSESMYFSAAVSCSVDFCSSRRRRDGARRATAIARQRRRKAPDGRQEPDWARKSDEKHVYT